MDDPPPHWNRLTDALAHEWWLGFQVGLVTGLIAAIIVAIIAKFLPI